MIHEIRLKTRKRDEMIDITAQAQALLENVQDGFVVVYSTHTTAGITINENADSDVQKDFLRRLDEIHPWDMPEDRHFEGQFCRTLKSEHGRIIPNNHHT